VFQEAISVNSSSLELCHIAASFELSQDNAASAISHLVKCVSRLFESHQLPNNPSAIDLYGQVLGQSISVENKLPTVTSDIIAEGQVYLWLNYTLLLELYGDYSGAIEAYETALYVLKNSHDVRKIWMQYLKYQCRRTASSQTMSREQKTFTDLVNRCLITMATQVHPPYSSTFLWSDYSFHNNVISLYLSCVKEDCWSAVYERYLRMMPDNAILALRWCQYEIRVGNLQEAQRICSGCIDVMPCCLPLWKVAILLELKQANYKEVHRMYWKATQALPFAATLWKDFILFEVAYSNRLEDIKEVIEVCQEIGINIEDYVATLLK
ncbi:zinc finger C3H1 domain-containing protein-like, partial [Saccoglossus kowalevskii]|uniref:Zinc finger C3H1 domain-containing protein-like n=1 Tax=Saccoglossus kowalevskii TaxID=10224 RepID=A0ABM0M3Y4_SACKO